MSFTTDEMRWLVGIVTDTASLLFIWRGQCGDQPVLMPGHKFYWWLDDPATFLHQAPEDDRRDRGGYDVH